MRNLVGRGFAGLGAAVQPGIAQSLDAGRTTQHHTGGEHTEHEVQQHAGQQGKAEGIDGAGGGRSKPAEHGSKDLGPEAVGRTESAHQDGSHDDNGHVAVNDGRQAHLEAVGQSAVQGLLLAQFLTDTLGRNDVGIHAHADTQDDTGNTGQGQGGTGEHGEVTGNHRQGSRHLTKQRDDGNGTGQAITENHDQGHRHESDDAGQHHDFQAAGTQSGADGGVAFSGQRERQRARIDLVGQSSRFLGGEITLDDGLTIGDGGFHRGGADVLIIQPDADSAVFRRQLGGGFGKLGGAFRGELQLDHVALVLQVACHGGFHIVTGEDLFAVGGAALAEHHLRGGADFVDGTLRIKVAFIVFPGETNDDTVFVIVHIGLVIGDAQADQTIFDNRLGCGHLRVGGIHVVRRHERYVNAAADIDAETDIRHALHIGRFGITVLIAEAKERRERKRNNQRRHGKKAP